MSVSHIPVRRIAIVVLALLSCCSFPCIAAETDGATGAAVQTGSISGTLTDPAGAVLRGPRFPFPPLAES